MLTLTTIDTDTTLRRYGERLYHANLTFFSHKNKYAHYYVAEKTNAKRIALISLQSQNIIVNFALKCKEEILFGLAQGPLKGLFPYRFDRG